MLMPRIARLAPFARRMRSEDGFSLPELIIYSIVSVIAMLIIVGIASVVVISGETVNSNVKASESAQSVTQSLSDGIRNSTGTKITAVTGGGQWLRARVATRNNAAVGYVCESWYYSPTDQTIRYDLSPTTAAPTAPSDSWLLLADGVTPVSGTGIFGGSWSRLTIKFDVTEREGTPSRVNAVNASRATTEMGSPCY